MWTQLCLGLRSFPFIDVYFLLTFGLKNKFSESGKSDCVDPIETTLLNILEI